MGGNTDHPLHISNAYVIENAATLEADGAVRSERDLKQCFHQHAKTSELTKSHSTMGGRGSLEKTGFVCVVTVGHSL